MPKNWLTVAVADAIEVVVPITMPDTKVASGRQSAATIQVADKAAVILYIIAIAGYEMKKIKLQFQRPGKLCRNDDERRATYGRYKEYGPC
jgi:hypothetical protein